MSLQECAMNRYQITYVIVAQNLQTFLHGEESIRKHHTLAKLTSIDVCLALNEKVMLVNR